MIKYTFIILVIVYATPIMAYDVNCGPNAMMGICQKFRIKANIDNLQELAWYDPEVGTTMLGLLHAANELNLPAVPLKLNYDELRKINKPGIVFIKGNHFSIVWKIDNDKVIFQDWPNPRMVISKNEFENIWRGDVIVFSKFQRWLKRKELALQLALPGPRIMFPQKDKNVGEVLEGSQVTSILTFVNIGSKPLIVNTRSSCSCTAAIISDKLIPPGKMGKIKVIFSASGGAGIKVHSIYVTSNDNENKIVKLSIVANIKSSIKVIPSRLWIDRVTQGNTIKKNIEVYSPSDTTFAITEIKASDGIKVIRRKAYIYENSVSIPISVIVNPHGNLGKYCGTIKFITNKQNVTIEVPVTGEIVGPIEAVPPVAFLGNIKYGNKYEHTITLRSVKKSVIFNQSQITVKSNIKGARNIDAVLKDGKTGEYVLLVSGKPTQKNIIVEGTIDILNNNYEMLLSVPVYGIVK